MNTMKKSRHHFEPYVKLIIHFLSSEKQNEILPTLQYERIIQFMFYLISYHAKTNIIKLLHP